MEAYLSELFVGLIVVVDCFSVSLDFLWFICLTVTYLSLNRRLLKGAVTHLPVTHLPLEGRFPSSAEIFLVTNHPLYNRLLPFNFIVTNGT